MNIFQILTPLTYWLLVAMWVYILFFLLRRLRPAHCGRGLLNTLIIILAIDALRTLFESLYFGASLTSHSGFLPIGVYDFLIRPEIVVIPKLLNVIGAGLIIGILLYRWFPAEKRDRELLESTIKERTNQLEKRNEQLRCEITERKRAEEVARGYSTRLLELQRVSSELSGADSFDFLCQQAVVLGRSRLGFDRLGLWFVDNEPGQVRGSFGTDEQGRLRDERESRLPVKGDSPMGRILSGEESLFVLETNPLMDDKINPVGQGSHALAALTSDDKIIGVLSADNLSTPGPFGEADTQILALYASTIAHLCSKKQAEEVARGYSMRLLELQRVTNELSRADSFDDLCRKAVEVGRSKIGFERLGLWFVDNEPGQIRGSFGIDEQGNLLDERETCLPVAADTPMGRIVLDGESLFVRDTSPLLDDKANLVEQRPYVLAALTFDDKLIGILSADNLFSQAPFSDADIQMLALYASAVGYLCRQKQAEETLRKSEQQYRLLATNTLDTIWTTDLEFNVTFMNDAVLGFLGYTPEEFAGRKPTVFTPPESLEVLRNAAEELIAKFTEGEIAQQKIEIQQIRKDGAMIDVEIRANLLLDRAGKVVGFQGRSVDITERKLAEAEKGRLLAAIDQAAEIVEITDTEGLIQYVNPAFEHVTGYSCEEAIGQNPSFLKSGEHNEAFYQKLWDSLLRGETWGGRFVNRKKDGTLYTEEATITPVKDSAGKTVNYVGIKSDVTAELVREEQIRRSQKMESVGRLAGGVAHDFNNILQTITGFCGLILAEMESQSPQRQDVAEIQKAVQHAGDLTQKLLAFSRVTPTEYNKFDLNTVLADGKNMLRQALDESFRLVFNPEAGLEPVNADASQILQIAMNLVVNARDAMPEGGTITIRTQNIEIKEKNLSDWPNAKVGKWACFSVSDAGCGMDEKQMKNLFDPFYTTKELGKGTGLGLSVVYGIVEEHGGWIHVDSSLGKGSTFKISLPMHNTVEAGAAGLIDPEAFSGKRILLAEDDPVIRELTAEILQDVGYAVSPVADAAGTKALFVSTDGAFDLLFMDVTLPDGDGVELASSLLQQGGELPVLLFSGNSDDPTLEDRCKENGFGFIRKPFSLKKLLEAVEQSLR